MCVQYVCTLLAVGSMEGVAHGYELWWGYPENEEEKSNSLRLSSFFFPVSRPNALGCLAVWLCVCLNFLIFIT